MRPKVSLDKSGFGAQPCESVPPEPRHRLRALDLGPLAAGRLLQGLGALITIRMMTQYLLPRQVGALAEIGVMVAMISLVAVTPVWHYCLRALNTWLDRNIWNRELTRFLVYIMVVASLGGMLTLLIQWRFGLLLGVSASVMGMLVALNVFFSPAYVAGSTGLNLIHRRTHFALFSNVPVWIGLGSSLLLIFLWNRSAGAWYLGQDLGYLAGGLSLVFLWRLLRVQHSAQLKTGGRHDGLALSWRSVFPFAWPISLRNAIWWCQSQGNRVLVAWLMGPRDLGMFAVAYGLVAAPLMMAENTMQHLYEPQFYADLARGSDPLLLGRAWEHFAGVYIPALILVGCYLGASGPLLAKLVLGPRFQVVGEFAAIPALSETLRGINSMFTNLGMAKLDMKVTISPVVAGAIATLSATALLAPRWSYVGALWGAAIGTAAVFLVSVVKTASVLPVRWPWRKMFNALLMALPGVVGLVGFSRVVNRLSMVMVIAGLLVGGIYFLLLVTILINKGLRSAAVSAAA